MRYGEKASIMMKELQKKDVQEIYKKIWKLSNVRLQYLTYRILNNKLPTGLRISKWDNCISKHCSYCGNIEDEKHLLQECDQIRTLWMEMKGILNMKLN